MSMDEEERDDTLAPLTDAVLQALGYGLQYALILLPEYSVPACVVKIGRAEVH